MWIASTDRLNFELEANIERIAADFDCAIRQEYVKTVHYQKQEKVDYFEFEHVKIDAEDLVIYAWESAYSSVDRVAKFRTSAGLK